MGCCNIRYSWTSSFIRCCKTLDIINYGKKFQRHAKGGRFKQQDFGDLGLSALKRNNDTIIDNLKLQSARNKEYRDDTEQSLRDVGRNELKNIQDLNSLENKIYKNKVGNIKVRADREIEAIRGQAKEAGKKSDFGKNSLLHILKSMVN